MTLTVFGASGSLGRRLVVQALDRGHPVRAVVGMGESPPEFPQGVTVIEADIYEGTNVEAAVDGATAVCNVCRHSRVTPPDYVTVGGRHVLEAMATAGPDRYLTVVPAAAGGPDTTTGLGEQVAVALFRLFRPTITADAAAHVDDVTDRDLDWTIVRPLRLTEGPPTRRYTTGEIRLGVRGVSNGDAAAFLLDCYERGIYCRMQPKIR
ncbi:NAD(P)-dependent oxidoreductase [Halohasta salina]|uniref:NAD(P)-dependent oxidoreductase n=1 Tax=Halohasta salina TaxID=2961621 RepID=UPI0020A32D20|nr:NAD(P)H-binding protein [Halohasta salina]